MLNNLQVLRAIAATLVVLTHLTLLNRPALVPWLGWGVYGVDLFFVISGFVMVYTTAGKPIGPGQFALNRIIRIVPLYWALTVAVFGIALVAPAVLHSTEANWVDLFKSLFFIPFRKGGDLVTPILFLGWTLNYEMFFYALFALSLALPSLRLRIWAMSAGLALLALAGTLLRPADVVAAFYTDAILIEFVFGMLLAYLYFRADFTAWSRLWPYVLLGVAALLIGVALAFEPALHRTIVWGIPSALIVWASVMLEAQGKSYSGPRLLLIGAASYALYLTHPFAFVPVERLARQMNWTSGAPLVLAFAAALALILGAAVLTHLLAERPVTEWLRAHSRSRRWSAARALWPWRLTASGAGDSRSDKSPRGD